MYNINTAQLRELESCKPLHNELIDAFTAKVVDVAPRVTFSSFSGKMSHTAQSRTDVGETVEDSAQD